MTLVSPHAIFSRSDYSYSDANRSKYVRAPVNRLVVLELDVRKQAYSLIPNRTVVIAIQTPVNQNVVLQIRAYEAMRVSTY
jgi:hypothetical protein